MGSRVSGPERPVTERGFSIYADFTDRYGHRVRVQQSSLATEDCAWIFCNRGERDPEGYEPSPHLTVEQARLVRDALSEFIAEFENQP